MFTAAERSRKVNSPQRQQAGSTFFKTAIQERALLQQSTFFRPQPAAIQRKCAACEEEKTIQPKRRETAPEAGEETRQYIDSLSGGRALSERERSFYEPRVGFDLSGVRLHTDSVANKSADSINALAYTHGQNIVFNAGQYQPETNAGKRLMAHELTHVVQQNTGIAPKRIQRLMTDEMLGSRGDEMSRQPVSNCGTTVRDCSGSCRAADGTVGVCQWGGITFGCRCRSNQGAEPAPVAHSVPWWVWGLGAAAAAAIIACFASGVCEVAAIVAAVGEGSAAVIIALMRAAGILFV